MKLRNFRKLSVNEKHLKTIGLGLTVMYFFACGILENGVLDYYKYTVEQISEMMKNSSDFMIISTIASGVKLLVGVALPIYAFMLVEGFKKSKDRKMYFVNLLALAFISEIPYNLCMNHSLWNIKDQNPVFSLIIAFIMLEGFYLAERINTKKFLMYFLKAVLVFSASLWTFMMNTKFGLSIVLLSAVFYLIAEENVFRYILVALIGCFYITGPMSIYFLYFYNGERGIIRNKYLYYRFFPVILLISAGISYII